VREDIKCLLSKNRNLVYRSTYELLKTVHEKERADNMGGGSSSIKD
jgi:hypothetical protein